MWLSKTEEVREDRAHWATNITGDIYGQGWISEMYGYSFGAAEVGLQHKINDNLMIYPGYTPREGFQPLLLHYGLPFSVGNWSFSKLEHHEDGIVYDCGRSFLSLLTLERYPAINKPAAVLHWLNHANIDAEFIVILDADMILRGPITPWEFKAARGRPVSTPYDYLIGCDNVLAKLHTSHPEACDKVGGVIIMHIEDLRKFAMLWLHKTEELQLRHLISREILIYPGYVPEPGVKYRVFHYGLEFKVGNWSFDKANWRDADMVNKCWAKFPDLPDPSTLDQTDEDVLRRDLLSIECGKTLNEALLLHHKKRNCPDPNSLSNSNVDTAKEAVSSRKFGRIDVSNTVRTDPVPVKHSQESSLPAATDGLFGSFRFWVIVLWAVSGLGFVAVMFTVFLGRKSKGTKGKSYRSKRRSSYSGFLDMNGRERLLHNAESSM
ncbi:hypothetical protein GH714_041844 [Hevea brasiliensis]|uniref:Hydroxyproline O-arabinosyltransferase-like domain-containing protein n=1 Tax=Hevea brasiliensis TaxID=3981 RepID=A0A6A6MWC9_HEVBR|nr:hypothetical protein GH714_041844 [Hevea brasiliensis]